MHEVVVHRRRRFRTTARGRRAGCAPPRSTPMVERVGIDPSRTGRPSASRDGLGAHPRFWRRTAANDANGGFGYRGPLRDVASFCATDFTGRSRSFSAGKRNVALWRANISLENESIEGATMIPRIAGVGGPANGGSQGRHALPLDRLGGRQARDPAAPRAARVRDAARGGLRARQAAGDGLRDDHRPRHDRRLPARSPTGPTSSSPRS